MVIKTASPGVVINEIDLTRGTIDAITQNVGAFAGPFERGPVDEITLVSTEEELIRIFGGPTDENYEYWWTVNNFLEYGGVCYVVRVDDSVGDSSGVGLQKMRNAIEESVENGILYPDSVYIKNQGDFEENYQWGTEGGSLAAHFVTRNPGDWGNSIGIAVIDRGADYQMSLKNTGATDFITGEKVDGTFGELPDGAVLELSLDSGGTGFLEGVSYPAITDSPIGSGDDRLLIEVTGTNKYGPVSALGDLVSSGSGYIDAVDVVTGGGSGSGLKVHISANDTGALTAMGVDDVYNNYKLTLDSANLLPSAKLVPLTVTSTGTGSGAIILGNFSTYNLESITISNGGIDYRVGDTFTISDISSEPVNPADNTTTVTVTRVNALGEVTAVSLAEPGDGYKIGDQVRIIQVGSSNSATIEIASVVANGAVEAFKIKSAGTEYIVGTIVHIESNGGAISTLTNLVGGAQYTDGSYFNVPLLNNSGGFGAVANFSVVGGSVSSVVLSNGGMGYEAGDILTADDDRIGGSPTGEVLALDIDSAGSDYFDGTYLGVEALGGSGRDMTLDVTVAGGVVTSVVPNNGGYGYDLDEVITVASTDIGGAPAGEVVSVGVTAPGGGYTAGTYTGVATTGGSGDGALTLDITVAGGQVTSAVVNTAGVGYAVSDVIIINNSDIGGDPTGAIVDLDNTSLVGGAGYTNGTYLAVPLTGGSGAGATADIVVTANAISSVVIQSQGTGYLAGETLSATDASLGGGGGAGFTIDILTVDAPGTGATLQVTAIDAAGAGASFSVSSVDLAGSGFQIEVGSIAVSNAQFTVTDVSKQGDTIPSGTSVGRYVKVQAPEGLDISDNALAYQSDSLGVLQGGVLGHVIGYEDGHYQIMMVSDDDFETGFYLVTNPSLPNEDVAGPITAVYQQGEYLLYNRSNISTDVINTIWIPNHFDAEYGHAEYGWDLIPRAGQKEILAGDTYVYSTNGASWVIQYTPEEDDLFNDGTLVFRLQAHEDWYTQQIAFQGVPWYRFAHRPLTTLNALDRGAANDGLHLIVYDADGGLTGSKGNVLEQYTGVSKLTGAETPEGENNYYIDVINNNSNYIFASRPLDGPSHAQLNSGLDDVGSAMGDGVRCAFIDVESLFLKGGVDNLQATLGEIQSGYDKYDKESVEDMDYILQGPAGSNLTDAVAKANFIISIVESRRDCMCFLSPPRYMVVNQKAAADKTVDIINWANEIASSSYAVMDSGYKYSYDRFNDEYRYMPLNGDIAGLMVFSSIVAEAWYSPAGLSRGQIRNVVKLPFEPSKAQRDALYTSRVNPVVTFPGEGTILYGDKTALGYSSAFDRINVRKLFLVVERAIAKAARAQLFEFNDEITRSLFKNLVNPYLRDVQAKRGMYDFLVVCDSSNNTPEVIDRNEFVADIYIKPARSINYITLNFIATKTGVTFDESVALFRGSNATTNR